MPNTSKDTTSVGKTKYTCVVCGDQVTGDQRRNHMGCRRHRQLMDIFVHFKVSITSNTRLGKHSFKLETAVLEAGGRQKCYVCNESVPPHNAQNHLETKAHLNKVKERWNGFQRRRGFVGGLPPNTLPAGDTQTYFVEQEADCSKKREG